MNKLGVYPEDAPDVQKKVWTSPEGATALISSEYFLDTTFGGVVTSFKVGLYDERIQKMDFSSSFQVSIGADGQLSGTAGAAMNKLVSAGSGQIAYEFILPCARLTRASDVPQKNFDWVSEVILGARVQGFLSIEQFQGQAMGAGAALSAGIDASAGTMGVGGRAGIHSVSAPKCIANRLTQDGGVRLKPHQFESKDLVELFKHLEETWAEETLLRPDTWQVAMIKVELGKIDDIGVTSPHAIVLGRTGTGKSSFLNSFLLGKKNCCGENIFKTSQGQEYEGSSCTRKPLTKVYELDAITADGQGEVNNVLTPFKLTDVPGLGAADLPDSRILADLFLQLGSPDNRRLHAIIWVEKCDEVRFSADHYDALAALEAHFGAKFWDLMVVVLTRFPYPKKSTEEQAKEKAHAIKREKANEMRKRIIELMPTAEQVWGDNQNMFFCIDNLDAQLTDAELKQMQENEQAMALDDASKGEAERRRQARDYARNQIHALRLHMVARTRNNQFWDSTERAQSVYRPPQDVVNLSDFSGILTTVPQLHTHTFGVVSFMKPTWCSQCHSLLKGVMNQGQQCSDPECLLTLCHSCAGNASTYAGSSVCEKRLISSSASSSVD